MNKKYSKREIKILCEEIKKKYSILDYVRSKGMPIYERGNRNFILCPFHGDNDPSLNIEKKNGIEVFYCFGCKTKGTIIDFYAGCEGISIGQAISQLGEGINFDFDISSLLKEFGRVDDSLSVIELNINISIHCFEYLTVLKTKFSKDFIDDEFEKMDSFYKKLDEIIISENKHKLQSYYNEICNGDFLTERMKKLEESNEV